MTLPTRPLTAIVCDNDKVTRVALRQAAEAAGFEILESVDNGSRLLQALEFHDPSLIVITHEGYGMTGLEVVTELSKQDPHPETILISSDEGVRDAARGHGVVGVPGRGDLEALERSLQDARYLLETGERRSSIDRRQGADRRHEQDWSKVTSERRTSGERRGSERRHDSEDT